MSTELPADDFPFLNRLLAEIKLLRETKRPRRSSAPKADNLSAAKRECSNRVSGLLRAARPSKTAKASEMLQESR